MPVIEASHLHKRFNLEAGFFAPYGDFITAVNDVSFKIDDNEAYGLVGESGCGKTSTARLLVRMYDADRGSILYYPDNAQEQSAPVDIGVLRGEKLRAYRQKVRYVFQDPARSLNPRMNIYEILVSGARRSSSPASCEKELRQKAAQALSETGLSPDDLDRRPSEFSGGQRQRISIARALLMQPRLLICDEVVSALDVSIQGQILNLLLEIREKRDISFLFIAHDLKVACYFCDRIGVMYRGELMEEAPAQELYNSALHPYTRLLFSSAAYVSRSSDNDTQNFYIHPASKFDAGQEKAEHNEKSGIGNAEPDDYGNACAFVQRCPLAVKRCFNEKPSLREDRTGHLIRCHLYD